MKEQKPGREWDAGASALQQPTPSQLHVEAIVELMTARLAELVNAQK